MDYGQDTHPWNHKLALVLLAGSRWAQAWLMMVEQWME
jgi:hypothetical protein